MSFPFHNKHSLLRKSQTQPVDSSFRRYFIPGQLLACRMIPLIPTEDLTPALIVMLLVFMLTGCAGDRLKAPTKCDAVSAVLSNPPTTRRQEAAAMEMGRNNHCFGN
jgi:hypothetical protein